jgi:hypothetical protein
MIMMMIGKYDNQDEVKTKQKQENEDNGKEKESSLCLNN